MTPQKLVVNRGYGGFSVEDEAVRKMREWGCDIAEELVLPGEFYSDGSGPRKEGRMRDCTYPHRSDIRTDEHLIQAVNEGLAKGLEVIEIPDDVEWVITEYDGAETVREKHRTFPSGEYARGIASSYNSE